MNNTKRSQTKWLQRLKRAIFPVWWTLGAPLLLCTMLLPHILSWVEGFMALCMHLFLKTLSFRSFHNSQVIRMSTVGIAFLCSHCALHTFSHHPWVVGVDCHWVGCMPVRPSQAKINFHTRTENRQVVKRCNAVSRWWQHNAHWPLFGKPRRCSRSKVHSLFCMTSHVKCLHLDGA